MKFKVIMLNLASLFILFLGSSVIAVIVSHFPPPWNYISAIIISFFWGVIVAKVFFYKLAKLLERYWK